MRPYLLVVAGPDKGHRFLLDESYNVLLGRSRHTVTRLNDPRVSRVHCEVELKGPRILVTDLDSGGGTFVNGQRVTEAALRVGDILRVGDTELRVEGGSLADQATLPPPVAAPARPVILSAERMHELTGTKLSHYTVGKVLARGQSGIVFLAEDFKHDRPVAFKVLWPEFSQNDEDLSRFVRAMRTMMPLRHAHLVALYGAGKTGRYCWVAMEYVVGESLTQLIERLGASGRLDRKRVLQIVARLACALEYAH
jgi:hypothetical protein